MNIVSASSCTTSSNALNSPSRCSVNAIACCRRWFAAAIVAFTCCTSVRTDVVM
jgi:hypothetical protein